MLKRDLVISIICLFFGLTLLWMTGESKSVSGKNFLGKLKSQVADSY